MGLEDDSKQTIAKGVFTMSLMSKVDALKAKATQDGANELDLMRAALVESQERYNLSGPDRLHHALPG